MGSSRIKQLEGLLTEKLDSSKKIVHIEEIDFLGKGENYGSTLFRVDVTVKDVLSGEEETIYTVAKTLPEEEFFRNIFNVQVTVNKEISFYNVLVPLMTDIIVESGVTDLNVDFFPKMHGGRLNLNGSDKVDEDSVILMDNLKMSGYKTVDRFEGFDYETSKIVIKNMATFHAIPLALKLKKPEVFEKKFRSLCVDAQEIEQPEQPEGPSMHTILMEILYQNDKCLPYAVKLAGKMKQMQFHIAEQVKEPWGTISHNDLWVNNIMVKYKDGKPVASKFVDFQNYRYDSPMKDLFFFMWTSIRQSVLETSYDELVKFYHENFVKDLDRLGCDIKPFLFEPFVSEMNEIAKNEILHVLPFMLIVFGKKCDDPDGPMPKFGDILVSLTVPCKEKIWYTVMESGRRRWL